MHRLNSSARHGTRENPTHLSRSAWLYAQSEARRCSKIQRQAVDMPKVSARGQCNTQVPAFSQLHTGHLVIGRFHSTQVPTVLLVAHDTTFRCSVWTAGSSKCGVVLKYPTLRKRLTMHGARENSTMHPTQTRSAHSVQLHLPNSIWHA